MKEQGRKQKEEEKWKKMKKERERTFNTATRVSNNQQGST